MTTTLCDRIHGCLSGLAVGDALGAPIEFCPPGTFELVREVIGGGRFRLKPGEWTDDTSMALCLAESLLSRGGSDPQDQLTRYVRWFRRGHLSSNGRCFDIGATTRKALVEFERSGSLTAASFDRASSGNGSLMRLAPVVLYYYLDPKKAIQEAASSSLTTHASPIVLHACRYFAAILWGALSGLRKDVILSDRNSPIEAEWANDPLEPEVMAIAKGSYKRKNPPDIKGTGYVVESLEAALWAFHRSSTFEEGMLLAVNLRDDADTTGAVYGQLAGAYYGLSRIPERWVSVLARQEVIFKLADRLWKRLDRPDSENGS